MRLKKISTAVLVLSLFTFTGCASTIANMTGSQPIGLNIGDRTVSQKFRDAGIESNALVNLYKIDSRYEHSARVDIHAFHDAVLVVGQVPFKNMIPQATKNILEIREAKVVHNELVVDKPATYAEIVNDTYIKTDIRKNLLLEPRLKDSRVKIIVELGVVYIMGILSQEEITLTLNTIQQTKGIKKIISLVDDLIAVEQQIDKERKKRLRDHQTPIIMNKESADKADKATPKDLVKLYKLEEDPTSSKITKPLNSATEQ